MQGRGPGFKRRGARGTWLEGHKGGPQPASSRARSAPAPEGGRPRALCPVAGKNSRSRNTQPGGSEPACRPGPSIPRGPVSVHSRLASPSSPRALQRSQAQLWAQCEALGPRHRGRQRNEGPGSRPLGEATKHATPHPLPAGPCRLFGGGHGQPSSRRTGARPAAFPGGLLPRSERHDLIGKPFRKGAAEPLGVGVERSFPRALLAASGARPGRASRLRVSACWATAGRAAGFCQLFGVTGPGGSRQAAGHWHRGWLATWRAEAGFQEPEAKGWTGGEAGPKLVAEALVSPHPARPPRVLALPRPWPQGAVDVSEHVTSLSAAC